MGRVCINLLLLAQLEKKTAILLIGAGLLAVAVCSSLWLCPEQLVLLSLLQVELDSMFG